MVGHCITAFFLTKIALAAWTSDSKLCEVLGSLRWDSLPFFIMNIVVYFSPLFKRHHIPAPRTLNHFELSCKYNLLIFTHEVKINFLSKQSLYFLMHYKLCTLVTGHWSCSLLLRHYMVLSSSEQTSVAKLISTIESAESTHSFTNNAFVSRLNLLVSKKSNTFFHFFF